MNGRIVFGRSGSRLDGYESIGFSVFLRGHSDAWESLGDVGIPGLSAGHYHAVVCEDRVFCVSDLDDRLLMFEPQSCRWHSLGKLPGVNLRDFSVAAVDDQIFVMGGQSDTNDSTSRCHAYDLSGVDAANVGNRSEGAQAGVNELRRIRVADMPRARLRAGVGVLNGRIHVVGGVRETSLGRWTTRVHEQYDPGADRWRRRRSLPRAVQEPSVASVGEYLYVMGGVGRTAVGLRPVPWVFRYDPVTDRWTKMPSLPESRRGHAAVGIGDRAYVVGGGSSDPHSTRTLWFYDAPRACWVTGSSLAQARRYCGLVAIHDYIVAIGGPPIGDDPSVERYQVGLTLQLYQSSAPQGHGGGGRQVDDAR